MKKLIAATAICIGSAALVGPSLAGAASQYPPTTDDPGSVSPVPFDALAGGGTASGAVSAGDAQLPTTGSNDARLLQIGGITLGVGVALAGGATYRRRRHTPG